MGSWCTKGQHECIEREFTPNSLKVWKDGEEIDSFGSSDAEDYIKTRSSRYHLQRSTTW